jgi:hypothetical protein
MHAEARLDNINDSTISGPELEEILRGAAFLESTTTEFRLTMSSSGGDEPWPCAGGRNNFNAARFGPAWEIRYEDIALDITDSYRE